jgi:MoxR-like ATPase
MPAKNGGFDQFKGSSDYVTSEELRKSVNVAISLGKPLLIRGEPGTGKTRLAHSIAKGLEKN